MSGRCEHGLSTNVFGDLPLNRKRGGNFNKSGFWSIYSEWRADTADCRIGMDGKVVRYQICPKINVSEIVAISEGKEFSEFYLVDGHVIPYQLGSDPRGDRILKEWNAACDRNNN